VISLERYNKESLDKLINSHRFDSFSFKPISHHRAVSHIHNPRAADDDTLLILAIDGDKLAGYIGILPDFIFYRNQKTKIGWLSTLFVHPDFRGKRIAQQLLAEACSQYEDKILITEFTPEAESMYVKSNRFEYVKPLKGYTYHYRANLSKILPQKKTFWEKYTSLLKGLDSTINLFTTPVLRLFTSKKKYKVTNKPDAESLDFIAKNQLNNSFHRNTDEISWIVNYPWVLNSHLNDYKYLFSSFAKEFKYVFIKMYDEKDILSSLMMLTVRDQQAKLQYKFGDYDNKVCAEILHQFIIKNKINSLICYDETINFRLKKEPALYKKTRIRKYQMTKNLKVALGNDFRFEVFGGDGDCVFT
jgi:GNAT superfamily N-acetyltransferase